MEYLTLDQICPQLLNTAFNALSLAPFPFSHVRARTSPTQPGARTHEPAHQCSAQESPPPDSARALLRVIAAPTPRRSSWMFAHEDARPRPRFYTSPTVPSLDRLLTFASSARFFFFLIECTYLSRQCFRRPEPPSQCQAFDFQLGA